MNDPEGDSPPLPTDRAALVSVVRGGCIAACGLALLPILYVASFVYILVDERYRWGLVNEQTLGTIFVVYGPLFWVYKEILTIAGN